MLSYHHSINPSIVRFMHVASHTTLNTPPISMSLLQISLSQRPQKRPSNRLRSLPPLLALLQHLLRLDLRQHPPTALPIAPRRPPPVIMPIPIPVPIIIIIIVSPTRPRRLLPLSIPLAFPFLPLLSLPSRLTPVGSVPAPVGFVAVVALAVVFGSVPAVVVAVAFALFAMRASGSRGRRRVV